MPTCSGISTYLAEKAGLPVDRFPSSEEEISRAETVLDQAIHELSIEEQEKIIFDIHGIATVREEDDGVIRSSMTGLEKEIEKIASKEAYDFAMVLNRAYVMGHDFRMMFLRACNFNTTQAAMMIVNHFETKRELFGDDALGRDIWQSDLSPKDLQTVRDGYIQLVPSRDVAGRFIVAYNIDVPETDDLRYLQRPIFYQYMAILREKEIFKSGLIWICYEMNPNGIDLNALKAFDEMESVLPLRSIGGHHCSLPCPSLRAMIAGIKLFSDNIDRFRVRSHFGTLEENTFRLQTYGIPTKDCPMKADGTWSTDFHLEWLETLRLQEERQQKQESSPNGVLMVPRRFDVLCGKSQRAKNSCGTQRALHLVDMYRDTYESKCKFEKTVIAEKILSLIRESGGRFLKESNERGRWEEMDDLSARHKISHWFRHLRFKDNLPRRVSDLSENSEKSERRMSWEDVIAESTSMILSEYEDGGPTKRVTPSLELDEESLVDDIVISRDIIFGDGNGTPDEIHASDNPIGSGRYKE